MQLTSQRFGTVEIAADAVIDFPSGLIGLGGSAYALLARGPAPEILWLQSLEDPGLALPVTDPVRFYHDYRVELTSADAQRVGLDDTERTSVYVTVRADRDADAFSANLRAPIIIAGTRGHQVINQAPDADVRVPLALTTRS